MNIKNLAQELRLQGQSLKQIAQAIGVSISTAGRYVADVKSAPCHPLYKTQNIQHDFFSKPNIASDLNRLVLVGFIAADGCISKRKHGQKTLIVRLAHKDVAVLETFNSLLANNTRTISISKNSRVIDFPSNSICDDLQEYGIVPRKTSVFTWPKLTLEEARPFLLGYFYGDGCFHKYKNRDVIHFISTSDFAYGLREFVYLHKLTEHCVVSPLKRNSIYSQTVFQGKHAQKLGQWLFQSTTIPLLPRKHPPELYRQM